MRASVVVLTYNQLKEGTMPCVESIFSTRQRTSSSW